MCLQNISLDVLQGQECAICRIQGQNLLQSRKGCLTREYLYNSSAGNFGCFMEVYIPSRRDVVLPEDCLSAR